MTYGPGGAACNEGVLVRDAPLLHQGQEDHQGDPSPGFPSSQAGNQLSQPSSSGHRGAQTTLPPAAFREKGAAGPLCADSSAPCSHLQLDPSFKLRTHYGPCFVHLLLLAHHRSPGANHSSTKKEMQELSRASRFLSRAGPLLGVRAEASEKQLSTIPAGHLCPHSQRL